MTPEIITSFLIIVMLDIVINSDFILQLRANIYSAQKNTSSFRYSYLKALIYSTLIFLTLVSLVSIDVKFNIVGFALTIDKLFFLILALYVFSKNYIEAIDIYNLKIYELNNKKINSTLSKSELRSHYNFLILFSNLEKCAVSYALIDNIFVIISANIFSHILFNLKPLVIIEYINRFYRLKLISILFSAIIALNLILKIFDYSIPSTELIKIILFTFLCELLSIFISKNHRKNSFKRR
jgi:hypothetical protein